MNGELNVSAEVLRAYLQVMQDLVQRQKAQEAFDLYRTMGTQLHLPSAEHRAAFCGIAHLIAQLLAGSGHRDQAKLLLEQAQPVDQPPWHVTTLLSEFWSGTLEFFRINETGDKLLDDPDPVRGYRAWLRYMYALGQSPDHPSVDHLHQLVDRFHERFHQDIYRNPGTRPPQWDGKRPLRVGMIHGFFHYLAYQPAYVRFFGVMKETGLVLIAYDEATPADQPVPRSDLWPVVDHWRATRTLDDDQLYRQIDEDQLDILVAMDGVYPRTRFGVFARRAACVQLAWHNNVHSMGHGICDFMIGDPIAYHPETRDQFHEVFLDTQPCFFGYNPFDPRPDCASEAPIVGNGHVTFCVYNRPIKLNPTIVGIWARLLERLPDARILLANANYTIQAQIDRVRSLFSEAGIAPERYRFLPYQRDKKDFIGLYNLADISLDTYPFGGGFSTGDALWQGVPVMTMLPPMPGVASARVSASMLHAAGYPELVCEDEQDFLARTEALARDIPRLQTYRREMRDRVMSSRLADVDQISREVADCFRRAMRIKQHWQKKGILDAPIEKRRHDLG